MNNTTNIQVSGGSGLSFSGALLILFVALKLTSTIDWSWWWVFAPLWLPLGVFLVVAIPVAMVAGRDR